MLFVLLERWSIRRPKSDPTAAQGVLEQRETFQSTFAYFDFSLRGHRA